MSNTLANITVEPINVSWDGTGLGYLDGNIEPGFKQELADIVAHQRGKTVLGAITVGNNIEDIELTLKECSIAQIKTIFGATGSLITPSGGTAVLGWGPKKDFKQVLSECKKLVLHPIAQGSGLTRDLAFWLAYPIPGSIVYSGEDPQTVTVSFKIYPDLTKKDEVQLFVYGDHSQDFAA